MKLSNTNKERIAVEIEYVLILVEVCHYSMIKLIGSFFVLDLLQDYLVNGNIQE